MARSVLAVNEFVAVQSQVSNTSALWSLVLDYFTTHGVPLVSYHFQESPAAIDAHTKVRTHGFPDDWVSAYVREKLFLIDPIPDLAMRSTRPFFWSETAQLTMLATEQSAYLDALAATGIGDGLAIQVFGPSLRNGYFGLGFGEKRRHLPAGEIAQHCMVCQIAHLRVCDLMPAPLAERPMLSRREREVLEWIARGKSNSVIGEILQVSTHTVDQYLRRIFAKLGVSDRTTAAIRGVGAGLVRGEV